MMQNKKTAGPPQTFPSAKPFLPARMTLASLRKAANACQGCNLFRDASRTVFGAGPATAQLMVVGEQPGDVEDRAGSPFVGPAGKLLNDQLAAAGLDRAQIFVTNAVKHFKWEPRGKRRLHAKPSARETAACKPWLAAEVAVVQPKLIVCLGATAASVVIGPSFRLTKQHGVVVESLLGPSALATYHPSAVLRAPSSRRDHLYQLVIGDLEKAKALLGGRRRGTKASRTRE